MNYIHDEELLSIGKLARQAGLTPDALRHYESVGLLTPAFISPDTGYRYYSAAQADILARIRELKAFGFPLADIKHILTDAPDMATLFRTRYALLLQEKTRITHAMEKLAQEIQKFEQEDSQ